MASYASDYDRRATPATHVWLSIATPRVFCEERFPASLADWSDADEARYQRLEKLAERYGTHVECNAYRRG